MTTERVFIDSSSDGVKKHNRLSFQEAFRAFIIKHSRLNRMECQMTLPFNSAFETLLITVRKERIERGEASITNTHPHSNTHTHSQWPRPKPSDGNFSIVAGKLQRLGRRFSIFQEAESGGGGRREKLLTVSSS